MPSVFTLSGPSKKKKKKSKGSLAVGECKCVVNTRTKRRIKLCNVGKSARNRSGYKFQKGGC